MLSKSLKKELDQAENNAKKVYKILSFQYKVIEKDMKDIAPEVYEQYKKLSFAKKIQYLDNMAAKLGM